MTVQTLSPEAVAQGQLDAYNERDIDTFMSYWADNAQVFEFPDRLLASGAAQIRERHITRFTEANLHGKLLSRMTMGSCVIDREKVARTFPEGTGQLDVIAIYDIGEGKIRRAWFIIGAKVLDAATK
ncbi:MAG: nuclear transport factor 2 family protein [Betaproteobacteria bacterium]|nr:nuclear transport factor 2 family protein [Betaproteobacteria bacterium]